MGELREVLCSMLATIWAMLAHRLISRRNRLLGSRMCQERVNTSNVVRKTKSFSLSAATLKAEVTCPHSQPFPIILRPTKVCHEPPPIRRLLALAALKPCVLTLQVFLWLHMHPRLLRNRQGARRHFNISEYFFEVFPCHPELSSWMLSKVRAQVPHKLRMVIPGLRRAGELSRPFPSTFGISQIHHAQTMSLLELENGICMTFA